MFRSREVPPADAPRPNQPGWRGRGKKAAEAARIYRWQQVDWTQQQLKSLHRRMLAYRLKLTALWAMSIALTAAFIWFLVYSPSKTLVLTAAVTRYRAPLPPNAWAREDIQAFEPLAGQTIDLIDLSKEMRTREMGLRALENRLRDTANTMTARNALVLYFSLHGVVDENGEPCLLLPDSTPTQTSTWLPVRDVLRLVKRQPGLENSYKLVVLDCTRMPSNWSLGLTYNAFTDRLAEVIGSEANPRLAVLNSTGPGQYGHIAPELRGSVFGYYLKRAFEGDADTWLQQGNGNSRISLQELTRYLQHHVNEWVSEHRNDAQTPTLFPANAPDFDVVWTYGGAGLTVQGLTSWWTGGSGGNNAVTAEAARRAVVAPYVAPPYLTTPSVNPPTISSQGIYGPTIARPAFVPPYVTRPQLAVPPVQGPSLSSSTISLDTMTSAGKAVAAAGSAAAKPDAAAKADDANADATPTSPYLLFTGQLLEEEKIDRLWLNHDFLSLGRVYSRNPVGWRRFQAGLLRLEQFAAAGYAYRPSTLATIADLESQALELAKPVVDANMPSHTLPLALRFGRINESPETINAIAAALDSVGEVRTAWENRFGPADIGRAPLPSKPLVGGPAGPWLPNAAEHGRSGSLAGTGPLLLAQDPAAADAPTGPKMPEGNFSYGARAQAVWLRAMQPDGWKFSTGRAWLDFVGLPEPEQEPGVAEMQFLRLLDRYLDPDPARRPNEKYIRMAVACRAMAEQSALPLDLRAYYASAELIQRGDEQRRKAEDLLFVGTAPLLVQAETAWIEAEGLYASAAAQSQTVMTGYAVRDDVWAELPYLAEWYARRLPHDAKATIERTDKRMRDQVIPLIVKAHQLGKALDDSIALGPAATKDLAPLVQTCLDLHALLRREFRDECDRLASKAAANEQTYREISEVLSIPLVPAAQRRELRDRGARIALQLISDHSNSALARAPEAMVNAAPPTTGDKAVPGDKGLDLSDLDRMTLVWPQHPLVAILNSEELAIGGATRSGEGHGDLQPSEQLAQTFAWGAAVRQQFEALPGQIEKVEEAGQAETNRAQRTGLDRRIRLGTAERLLRSAAVFYPGQIDADPVDLCRRMDLHNLFLWLAERTMQDFLGSGELDGEPFYQRVAARYMEAGENIASVEGKAFFAEDEQSWQRWKDLRTQLGEVVQATTDDLLLSGTETSLRRDLRLSVSQRVPEGTASVWLRENRGPTLPIVDPQARPVLRLPVPVVASTNPQVRDPLSMQLPFFYRIPVLNQSEPRLEAVAFYRGHVKLEPFFLERSTGSEIRYTPPPLKPARINVLGQIKRRGSVMFILDCSQSMTALTNVESPDPDARRLPRMDVASTALRAMLGRMAQQGNFYVGLRLYGHRAGRNLERPNEILYQQGYLNPIPEGLLPSEDVETVLSLGRFAGPQYVQVEKVMATIKPWGETPLYLSIQQALRDFDNDDPQVAKSIVAITDGANYQFNSPRPVGRDNVLAALRERRIPVYIVGFGLDAGERGRAEREFDTIAQASGGKYYQAADGTGLAEALNRLLRPGEFSISDLASGQVLGPHLLGDPIDVVVQPGTRRKVRIRMNTGVTETVRDIDLAGGEALEVQLSDDGRKLEFRRDLRGNPLFSRAVPESPTEPLRFVIGAHRPEWTGSLLTFPVSFQNAVQTEFSPPPAEVWVEIVPNLPSGREERFVFYDLALQPGREAPVQQCRMADWPADSRKAKISVWWKMTDTPPDMLIPLTEFPSSSGAGRGVQEGSALQVPTAPEVSVRVQILPADNATPLRLVVLESCSEKATDLNAVKVTTSILPAEVSRRYDRENRLAVHTFLFPGLSEADLRSQCRVLVTSTRSVKAGAFFLKEPLDIAVPNSPDVIAP